MAFFGIGKKSPKAGPKAGKEAASVATEDGAMEFGEAVPVAVTSGKKGRFGFGGGKGPKAQKVAKTKSPANAANPKGRTSSGEPNIYTGILAAAVVVLAAGCVFVAIDNLSGVAGTNDEGNPLAVISSR
ncbi:MAG: hypothetical protein O3B75_04020 [Planctomycetota bacterium]|nr:hypothetical protein [Planctomycetota bacterium]